MLRFMPYLPRIALAAIICLLMPSVSYGRQNLPPYSWSHPTKAVTAIPVLTVASVDKQRLLADDDSGSIFTGKQAAVTKRLRIAMPNTVSLRPQQNGQWESLPGGAHLWRMRIHAEGATDLNFGFGTFNLPAGVQLHLLSGTETYYDGAYTSEDNTSAHQFWSPLIPGDSATVELYLPAGAILADSALELTYVGAGSRVYAQRRSWLERFGHLQYRRGLPIGRPLPERGSCGSKVYVPRYGRNLPLQRHFSDGSTARLQELFLDRQPLHRRLRGGDKHDALLELPIADLRFAWRRLFGAKPNRRRQLPRKP